MSYTSMHTESNYFKVKNTDEVRQVLESADFVVCKDEGDNSLQFYTTGEGTYFGDNIEVVLSLKPTSNNTNLIGIISDNIEDSVDLDELEEGTYIVQDIVEYLQDQLEEKSAITVTTAGYEGKRSGYSAPFGDIFFISKNTFDFMSLGRWAEEQASKYNVEI